MPEPVPPSTSHLLLLSSYAHSGTGIGTAHYARRHAGTAGPGSDHMPVCCSQRRVVHFKVRSVAQFPPELKLGRSCDQAQCLNRVSWLTLGRSMGHCLLRECEDGVADRRVIALACRRSPCCIRSHSDTRLQSSALTVWHEALRQRRSKSGRSTFRHASGKSSGRPSTGGPV